MNYIVFDSKVYYSNEEKSGTVEKGDVRSIFVGPAKDVAVAVITTLQKTIAAPERSVTKIDEAVAEAFTQEYITQIEPLDKNLFQVVATEKKQISEIYKYLEFENVKLVVPYGVALREYLKKYNLFKEKKVILFIDQMDDLILLTFFNDKEFTTPRRILATNINRLNNEIMRSLESYRVSIEKEGKKIEFFIVTNSRSIHDLIKGAILERHEDVSCVEDIFPALLGLRDGKFSMHFLLPEKFIQQRRLREVKKKITDLGVMGVVFAVFFGIFLLSFNIKRNVEARLTAAKLMQETKLANLKVLYMTKYQDIIRKNPKLDFPDILNSFIDALPEDYTIEGIIFDKVSPDLWRFEAVVYLIRNDTYVSSIPLPKKFSKAKIENILVKGNPGKRITLEVNLH